MNRKFITLPATLLMSISLAACAASSAKQVNPVTGNSMQPTLTSASIDKAMESALADAEANGNDQEILAMLSQVHARNPEDAIVATRYAHALREDEQIKSAERTLEPFVSGDKINDEAVTEMAMVQLALGEFKTAEEYAKQATKLSPKNARAHLALGTALDAQTKHQEAELAFRNGLKYWQGDPSPILNNLALNLASQGHLNEALSLLEKAKKIAPERIELERNRRIIATLVETNGDRPPAPIPKPVNHSPQAEAERKAAASSKSAPKPSAPPVKKSAVPSAQELNAANAKAKPKPAPKAKAEEPKEEVKAENSDGSQPNTTPPKTKVMNIKLKPLNE